MNVRGEKVYSLQKYLRDGRGGGDLTTENIQRLDGETLHACPDAGFCRAETSPEDRIFIFLSSSAIKGGKIPTSNKDCGESRLVEMYYFALCYKVCFKTHCVEKPNHCINIKLNLTDITNPKKCICFHQGFYPV